jgi:hypothetical protein
VEPKCFGKRVLIEKETRHGVPKLEQNEFDSFDDKQELLLMFPKDDDVQVVKNAMWDPIEYFMTHDRDGSLKRDFKQARGNVSYRVPCHSRVQNDRRRLQKRKAIT